MSIPTERIGLTKLVFRRAVSGDVETIVRIVNAGGPDGRPRKELPDPLPTVYMNTFQTIDDDANQWLMVVEYAGEIVGTFHLTYITYLAAAGRPDLQIEAIHVRASHRGYGIGTAMLQWAITEARQRNCRRVQLTTDKKRSSAHKLYLRLGFVFSHEGAKLYLD